MVGPLQMRRDTSSNWTAANPTLFSGEMGIETDTQKYKIGDGVTAWNSLLYATFGYWNLITSAQFSTTTPSVAIATLTFTFAASTSVTASASVWTGTATKISVGMYIYNSSNDAITYAKQITAISADGLTITLATSYAGTTGAAKAASVAGHLITMNVDLTAIIPIGAAVKYVVSATTYYGQVTALTSGLMTIAGPPVGAGASGITSIWWGNENRVIQLPVDVPGYFEETAYAGTSSPLLFESLLFKRYGIKWILPKAYCVRFVVINGVADTGTPPRVNLAIATMGGTYAPVSTSIATAGPTGIPLPVNNTSEWSTIVDISSANYVITNGQYIEGQLTKGTDTVKAQNLSITAVFVFP